MRIELLFAAALFVFSPAFAKEGSGAHGTDFNLDQHNPWFLGEKAIEYCVEGRSDVANVDTLVIEAFAEWKQFLQSYGLDTSEFYLGKQKLRLAVGAKKIPICTDLRTQLRIVFSAVAPDGRTGHETLGGAFRRPDYDHRTFRTGGIVWIYSGEKDKRRLKHVLLHELGHVFGMVHDSVWVMWSKAAERILQYQHQDFDDLLGKIEAPTWKYRLRKNDSVEFPYVDWINRGHSRQRLPEAWIKGLHESAGQAFFSETTRRLVYEGLDEDRYKRFRLEVSDKFGRVKTIKGKFERVNGTIWNSGPSLYTQWSTEDRTVLGNYVRSVPLPSPVSGFERKYFEMNNQLEGSGSVVFPIPAAGDFELDGKVYPAIIEGKAGAVLRVYDPEVRSWFQLTGHPLRRGEKSDLDI